MYRSFTHACTILVASGPPLKVPSPYRCIGLKEQEHYVHHISSFVREGNCGMCLVVLVN